MRLLRHWKMILGLLAIFVAGMGTGGFLAITGIIKIVKHNAKPDVWVAARIGEMEKGLKLTPEQKEKLRPIFQDAVEKFQGIVRNGFGEFLQVVEGAHSKMNEEFTPEQREKFVKMRSEAMKRWRDFMQLEVLKAPQKGL